MCPLCANLRQFYQRWAVLLFYGAVGIVVCCLVVDQLFDEKTWPGEYAGLLIPGVILGVLTAVMQMEVLSKPFSFCLPGHHAVIRRLVLLLGLVESVVFSLPFVRYPGLFDTSPTWGGLVLCSAFCVNLLVYMACIAIGFTVKIATVLVSLLPAIVVLAPMVGLDVAIERSIVQFPLVIILLTAIMAVVGWWWLGRPAWFRHRSGQYWPELWGPWNRSQTQRCQEVRWRSSKNLNPAVDRFLLHAIAARGLSDLSKHIWGALYPTCALIIPQWRGQVFVVVFGTLWAGYQPSAAHFVMGVIPMILAGFSTSHAQSLQLVPVGRRERLAVALVLTLGFGAVSVLVVGMAVALTHLLAAVVPPMEVKGIVLALRPISPTVLWVPLAVFPGMTLIHALFHTYSNPARFGFAMGGMFFFVFVFATPLGKYVTVIPATVVFGVLVLWAACLAAAYRLSMHGDLARQ